MQRETFNIDDIKNALVNRLDSSWTGLTKDFTQKELLEVLLKIVDASVREGKKPLKVGSVVLLCYEYPDLVHNADVLLKLESKME